MPTVPYTANNFDVAAFPNLQASGALTFTWPQLVWATVTVGKAEEHQSLCGIYSAYERSMRTALIYSSLMESATGRIVKAPSYEALDPSEKTAVSFYIGMTLVRLFSYSLFKVDWLLHLDLYKDSVNAQTQGRSRPDFLGLNENEEWVVFESKGRSDYVTGRTMENLMGKAKAQSALLTSINGAGPLASFGAVSHFMDDGVLRFDLDDPPTDKRNEQAFQVAVPPGQFYADYYKPFSGRRDSTVVAVGGHRVRVTNMGELDVITGVDEDILAMPPTVSRSRRIQLDTDHEFLGRDGVYVSLGTNWSARNMKMPPTSRE
jgi:hypothetical protein